MSCSSLAVPPGGCLVDLRVPPADHGLLEERAATARSIHLSPEDALDLLWRTWGAHTPDHRFEAPVGTSGRFTPPRPGEITALRNGGGHLLGLLEVEEIREGRVVGTPQVLDVPVPAALRPVSWRPAEVREVLERHDRWPVLGLYAHRPPQEPMLAGALDTADEVGGLLLLAVRLPSETASRDRRLEELAALGARLKGRAVVAAAPAPAAGLDPEEGETRILRTYGAGRVLVFDDEHRPAMRPTADDTSEVDYIGSLLA